MSKTRVMIVDDQYIPRQLFEMYVKTSENYELVYSVETAAFSDTYILSGNVDLIIMDILMQDGSNGLKAAEKIKRINSQIKIIAVTSMADASWLSYAKKIGVESFWYKEASEETILEIMDKTMAGEHVYPDAPPTVQIGCAVSSEFTERELQVLRAMTAGVSNSAIAEKLGIAENTVKMHIKHMIEKTGCQSRTELAVKARINGIVVNMD